MNGSIYTWSSINSYFASYLHYNGNEKITTTDTYFLMPCIFLVQYFFMSPGVKLGDRITVRGSTIVAVVLMVGSYLFLILSTNFYLILLGFSLFGLGDGLGNLSVIKNCWLYFPNNKALVNGIILGAYGLNSAILNPLADFVFINPKKKKTDDNGYYPPEVANNLLNFLYFIMIMFGVMGTFAILLTIPYEKDLNEKINDVDVINHSEINFKKSLLNKENTVGVNKNSNGTRDSTINTYSNINSSLTSEDKSSKSRSSYHINNFWTGFFSVPNLQLGIICFSVPFFLYLLTNTNRAFGNLADISQSALQIMAILFGVVNGTTRFMWGLLMDKFSFKPLMLIIMILESSIAFSVYFSKINEYLYIFENLMCAICLSGFFVTITPTFNKVFGFDNGAKLYGLTGITIGVASFLGPIVTKIYIGDKNEKDLYRNVYFLGGFIVVLSLISLFMFEEKSFEYDKNVIVEEIKNENTDTVMYENK
jgi:MFS family permease